MVYWSRLMMAMFRKEEPAMMFIKYDLSAKESKTVNLMERPEMVRKRRSRNSKEKTVIPCIKQRQKYKSPPGICKAKNDDLLQLCEKQLIAERYHNFFKCW